MLDKILTKEFLIQELVENKKAKMFLANEINTSVTTINKYLKQYGINLPTKHIETADKIGKKFGKWTVLHAPPKKNGRSQKLMCLCDCGVQKLVDARSISSGTSKSCGCEKRLSCYNGYEKINGVYWKKIHQSALDRFYEFEITIEQAWEIYIKQEKKCAITGISIDFMTNNSRSAMQTASLDRIDNSKGYFLDNVQWIHKQVNFLKGVISEEELLFWCREIYLNNKEKSDEIDSIKFRVWGRQAKNSRFTDEPIETNFK